MIIPYEAIGFSPSIKKGDLTVTWAELVWAAVTYGKSSVCYHLKYPGHSRAEKKYRAYLLYTCLKQEGEQLFKSGLYEEMDQTEKGAASYFLGMVLTKIFADRLLDIPLLWHVSKSSQAISFAPGKSRPDLIGCSSKLNEWIVAEAKGRSDGFNKLALSKAKEQSQMVTTINGNAPKFRFGSESYFSPHLQVVMEDPPAEREAIPVKFNTAQALAEYYSILPLLNEHGAEVRIHGVDYVAMYDEDVGVSIGLPANFVLPILESELRTSEVDLPLETRLSQLEYVGRDGFFIRLDSRWSEHEMEKEPHMRGG
jgi:hypothetical protein